MRSFLIVIKVGTTVVMRYSSVLFWCGRKEVAAGTVRMKRLEKWRWNGCDEAEESDQGCEAGRTVLR